MKDRFINRRPRNFGKEKEIIEALPEGRVNILDFMCGTGSLSRRIKAARPQANIYALEENMDLLIMALRQYSADKYITELDSITANCFDVVIVPLEVMEPKNFDLFKLIKSKTVLGGLLTVRDGYEK